MSIQNVKGVKTTYYYYYVFLNLKYLDGVWLGTPPAQNLLNYLFNTQEYMFMLQEIFINQSVDRLF